MKFAPFLDMNWTTKRDLDFQRSCSWMPLIVKLVALQRSRRSHLAADGRVLDGIPRAQALCNAVKKISSQKCSEDATELTPHV